MLTSKGNVEAVMTIRRTGFTPIPRDLAEAFMMLDFIAGKPNRRIDDLEIELVDPVDPTKSRTLKVHELLAQLRTIELRYINSTAQAPAEALSAEESGLTQLVTDALTARTNPACGATIAYTNFYVRRWPGRKKADEREDSVGGYELFAHPELETPAKWHRRINNTLICVVLACAVWALWESSAVTLGKTILQARQDLRIRQASLASEKMLAMTKATTANDWSLPPLTLPNASWYADQTMHLSFDFCERPRIWADAAREHFRNQYGIEWPHEIDGRTGKPSKELLQVFESPRQQEVCNRDAVLRSQFAISTAEMAEYVKDWTSLVGPPFGSNPLTPVRMIPEASANKSQSGIGQDISDIGKPGAGDTDRSVRSDDTEIRLAPKLLVLGNFLLPVIFAFLGAAAHVVLEFYTKLQTSTLTPDDRDLGLIRLVLGMVVGTCIGLAFSSAAPPPEKTVTDLVAALSLTASGISFLAGFGVEGVFDMLGQVVKRVFPSPVSAAIK